MKKYLLLFVASSMIVFTACNKQEVVEIQPEPEETFAPAQQAKQQVANGPLAAFTIENENGQVYEAEDLLLTNKSENAVSYEWDFGNGDTSTEKNPSYQYEIHGYYTITLKTTDRLGNTQRSSQNLSVLCVFGGGDHDE